MEKISVYCTLCHAEIHVTAKQLGREVRCPHCRGVTLLADAVKIGEVKSESSADREKVVVAKSDTQPSVNAGALRRRKTEQQELDMTPMVDVTFLLLIFFMVTAAFALQRSIEVPPQNDENAKAPNVTLDQPEEQNVINVRIT
ncbi:MAG: ExbD/TolR family protein, partial [Thermoguttaceae bacterium]